jgi:primosomal replication protein N
VGEVRLSVAAQSKVGEVRLTVTAGAEMAHPVREVRAIGLEANRHEQVEISLHVRSWGQQLRALEPLGERARLPIACLQVPLLP